MKSRLLVLLIIGAFGCLHVNAKDSNFIATEESIRGYWRISSLDSGVTGVIYLFMKDGQLHARGVRVNVENQEQDVSWVCQQGDKKLRNKAIWATPLFKNMQRDKEDLNFFYNGMMQTAFGCFVVRPEVIFSSENKGSFHIPKSVEYHSFDTDFTLDVSFHLEKISKEKAMKGCLYKITKRDMQKWGDLANSEKARFNMLKEMKLTKPQWLNLVNQDKICMDF